MMESWHRLRAPITDHTGLHVQGMAAPSQPTTIHSSTFHSQNFGRASPVGIISCSGEGKVQINQNKSTIKIYYLSRLWPTDHVSAPQVHGMEVRAQSGRGRGSRGIKCR